MGWILAALAYAAFGLILAGAAGLKRPGHILFCCLVWPPVLLFAIGQEVGERLEAHK